MIEMPEPRFVAANGLTMAVYAAGPADTAAPPIVLLHGWPELAFSWRHQIKGLSAQGFRVLAPDQRGYGRTTGAPAAVEAYDLEHLTGDLIGLLDAEGIEKAVFVGHDWGGIVAWRLPLSHPERVAGVVGVNTPFLARRPVAPIALFKARFGEDFYIVFFQKPGEAEKIFEADVERFFRFIMRTAEGFTAPDGVGKAPSLALQEQIKSYDPVRGARQQFLSDDEIAVFVETFKQTGFTGGINWYRNFTRNWERSGHFVDHIPHPALMIMAEGDAVLPPSLADGMERYVPNLTKHLVKGSGHWTQQEKPEEVTRVIADWMRATFPQG